MQRFGLHQQAVEINAIQQLVQPPISPPASVA
jgi:hypothetical protein